MSDKIASENNSEDKKIPWDEMKHEYVTGNVTYSQLSKKYGVSIDSIKKKAQKTDKRKGWFSLRREFRNKTYTKAEQLTAEKRAKELARAHAKMFAAACDIIKKTEDAIKEVSKVIVEKETKTKTCFGKNEILKTKTEIEIIEGLVNTKSLLNLAKTLESVKELIGEEKHKAPVGIIEIPQMQKPVPPPGLLDDEESGSDPLSEPVPNVKNEGADDA